MENLISPHFTWWQLLHTALWLAAIFISLCIIARWLALGRYGGANIVGQSQRSLQTNVEKAIILYEPMAVLVLGAMFIFINPILHGTVVLVLLIAGFTSFKNYINGRFMLLNSSVVQASRIKTKAGEGLIARRGRLGLYLRTDNGLQHIPYSQLMENSYTLVSGEDVERLWRVRLTPKEEEDAPTQKLLGVLATIPYLDRNHRPELAILPDGSVEAGLLFRSEKYLPDFMQAIGELGWDCAVSS